LGSDVEAFELSENAKPDSSNGSGEEREAAQGSDRGEQSADRADSVKKSQKTFHSCKITLVQNRVFLGQQSATRTAQS
jgi:hypothetical protein